MDGEQGGHATSREVDRAEQVAGALGRHHADVNIGRRIDPSEMDVEAVGKHQQLAGPQVRLDLGVVDRLLGCVGHEDHDDVRVAHGVGNVGHAEPGVGRERA